MTVPVPQRLAWCVDVRPLSLLLIACYSPPSPTPLALTVAEAVVVPEASRGCRTPVAERQSDAGCFLTATTPLGPFTLPEVYWHLYVYGSLAAAETARDLQGIVVHSFGRHWVYTIAPPLWQPGSGLKVAVIGPLAVSQGAAYTARFMEAIFPPGFQTPPTGHRHSGAEAWYVVEGAQCLETPDSLIIARAGEGAVVPAGPPMAISGYGPGTRKAVLLVLHPSDEPWVSPSADWAPLGRCRQ